MLSAAAAAAETTQTSRWAAVYTQT